MSGFVSHYLAALVAAVNDYISALGVGKRSYWAQKTLTFVCTVARIDVNVEGVKAKRAVVTRGISKRKNLFSAILTDEAVVILRKSFVLHNDPYFPTQNFANMSFTTSSETALPSSSAIAPSARSTSDEATSCARLSSRAPIAESIKSIALPS